MRNLLLLEGNGQTERHLGAAIKKQPGGLQAGDWVLKSASKALLNSDLSSVCDLSVYGNSDCKKVLSFHLWDILLDVITLLAKLGVGNLRLLYDLWGYLPSRKSHSSMLCFVLLVLVLALLVEVADIREQGSGFGASWKSRGVFRLRASGVI